MSRKGAPRYARRGPTWWGEGRAWPPAAYSLTADLVELRRHGFMSAWPLENNDPGTCDGQGRSVERETAASAQARAAWLRAESEGRVPPTQTCPPPVWEVVHEPCPRHELGPFYALARAAQRVSAARSKRLRARSRAAA